MLTALDILKFKALEEMSAETNIEFRGIIVQFFCIHVKREGDTEATMFSIDDALGEAQTAKWPNLIDQKTVNRMTPAISYYATPYTAQNSTPWDDEEPLIEIDEVDIRNMYDRYSNDEPKPEEGYTFLSPIESLAHTFQQLAPDEVLAVANNQHWYYVVNVASEFQRIDFVSGSGLLRGPTPEQAEHYDNHRIEAFPDYNEDLYAAALEQTTRITYHKHLVEVPYYDTPWPRMDHWYILTVSKKEEEHASED